MSLAPEDDEERTIVRPASGEAAHRDSSVQPGHVLPVGMRLRDYEITGLIGEGGFGIVYLAYDPSLQRRVAIKEYMPSSMASRGYASAAVFVKSDRHEETFKAGLKSFVNEARLLARFDHPALVKVYRFWEENGTAYMVMPYYEGPTLKSVLATRPQPPDEAALRALLRPLLDALGVMHAAQCYHRDIAPDNILLTPTGPLLLDFGAARRVIGDMTHALTVVLKPGYAPIEQYGDVATMTQGAWTDLYALACVVYFAITGKVPMSSVERLMDDRLQPLSEIAAGRYSPRFLRAIDAALALRPQDRPQTDAQFRALLDEPGSTAASIATLAPDWIHEPATREPRPNRYGASNSAPGTLPGDSTVLQTASGTLEVFSPRTGDQRKTASPLTATRPASGDGARVANRSPIYVAGAALCVIALAVSGLYFFDGKPASGPQSSPRAASSAAPSASTAAVSPAAAPQSAAELASAPAPVDTPTGIPSSGLIQTPVASPSRNPTPALARDPKPAPDHSPGAALKPTPVAAPGAALTPTPSPTQAPSSHPESTAPAGARATPAGSSPEPAAAPARTRRDTPLREESLPHVAAPPPTPVHGAGAPSRCSDILQKASLEPLTADEAAFLKRECR